jgi:hypothetical protein
VLCQSSVVVLRQTYIEVEWVWARMAEEGWKGKAG